MLRISPHLVEMRENTDQKNYEYGHFSRSVYRVATLKISEISQENILPGAWFLEYKTRSTECYLGTIRKFSEYSIISN